MIKKDNEKKPCVKVEIVADKIQRYERVTILEAQDIVENGGDVFCDDEASAYSVASSFPKRYAELPHLNRPRYYSHFHPWADRSISVHPHIWYFPKP